MGSVFSDTVYNSNGICSSMLLPRDGIITSWKTSHGPAKSITVAPSERANATGILPFAGGLSLLVAKANELSELVATTTPKQALVLMKSLLFIFQPPRRSVVGTADGETYFAAEGRKGDVSRPLRVLNWAADERRSALIRG